MPKFTANAMGLIPETREITPEAADTVEMISRRHACGARIERWFWTNDGWPFLSVIDDYQPRSSPHRESVLIVYPDGTFALESRAPIVALPNNGELS